MNAVVVRWVRRGGQIEKLYPWLVARLPKAPFETLIEERSKETDRVAGKRPAWTAYGGASRRPNEVRSARIMGRLYADLVSHLAPATVVEFGTAFGVSGMYFSAALNHIGSGRLYTFEPNRAWPSWRLRTSTQSAEVTLRLLAPSRTTSTGSRTHRPGLHRCRSREPLGATPVRPGGEQVQTRRSRLVGRHRLFRRHALLLEAAFHGFTRQGELFDRRPSRRHRTRLIWL